jgi:hypothetical protein
MVARAKILRPWDRVEIFCPGLNTIDWLMVEKFFRISSVRVFSLIVDIKNPLWFRITMILITQRKLKCQPILEIKFIISGVPWANKNADTINAVIANIIPHG